MIGFHFKKNITLKRRIALKTFLQKKIKSEKRQLGSLNYIFCSDKELLQINQSFLNHDYYTDIITFDLSDTKTNIIEGEIYISTDRVKENSKNFDTKLINELHRVVFHGVLHLCGYKDKSPQDQKIMRKKENAWLLEYFNSILLVSRETKSKK